MPVTDDTDSFGDRDEYQREFYDRVLGHVETILKTELDSETARKYVYGLAFKENDVLPKRDRRPKPGTAFQADQIHRIHGGDEETRATLVQFALVVAEYYDVVDDVVDGDVKPGHEREALLVAQLLMPVLARLLHRLGDDAVEYWTREATALVEAPLIHESADGEPTGEAYLDLLERQASLRSSITGLAAVVAGADGDAVERAENVGTAVHKLMQFATDLAQYESDNDPWNAVALFEETAYFEQLRSLRDELDEALSAYPDEYACRMRAPWEDDVRPRYEETVRET
jgi:hypothetical protein